MLTPMHPGDPPPGRQNIAQCVMRILLVKITVHLIFHLKTTSPLIEQDNLNYLCIY